MTKLLSCAIIVAMAMFFLVAPVTANITVEADGSLLSSQAILEDGRALLPARDIMEALGGSVSWDEEERTLIISRRHINARLEIDHLVAYIGKKEVALETPPRIINGQVKIPLRFAAELLGMEVSFHQYARLISLQTPQHEGIIQATIIRVIDGDTVELEGGERVRFIGVDAPEVDEVGGAEATEFVKEILWQTELGQAATDTEQGAIVWLEADGNNRDRFGRLRRYIWLQQPLDAQNENEIRRHQLNALLLKNGHARVMIIGTPRNEQLFRRIEAQFEAVSGS